MKRALTDDDLLHLTPQQTIEIYRQGQEMVTWALLRLAALAGREAHLPRDPSTPSAQVPPYAKAAARKSNNKRGRKNGHKGERRRPPLAIDRRQEHMLAVCPDCGGLLRAF